MKLKRTYKQKRITDIDYNELVSLLGSFKTYNAYKKRLRIYSEDVSKLNSLLRNNYKNYFKSSETARENGKAFVRLFFSSESSRNNFKNLLEDIKANGQIVSYDGSNGVTANGKSVKLTGTPGKTSSGSGGGNGGNENGGLSENTKLILIVIAIAVGILFLIRKKKA